MKKHEITDNDLELIFNNIIEQAPLINESQVRSLLDNQPKVPEENSFRQYYKTHFNALTIGSIFLIIAAFTIYLANNERNTDNTVVRSSVKENRTSTSSSPNDTINNKSPIVGSDSANKDIETKPVQADTSSLVVRITSELSISDIYRHLGKKPQVFSIRPDRDTIIVCREGTTLRIKANSFVSEKTGQKITDNIQMKVKEYYKLSDILMARISTTSDGKIIETGGMLHLSATAGNENCILKQGEKLEIGFPYSKKKDDMILFSGEQKNDQINWKPVENYKDQGKLMISEDEVVMLSSDKKQEEVFMVVEEMPEFPGGVTNLRRYIQENTHYPYSALKDKLEGTVYVNFVVDRAGYVRNIRVARGLGNVLDKAAAYIVSQIPCTWKPGKQRGQPVNVPYTVPVTLRIKDSDTTDEGIRQANLFEKQLAELKYDETSKRLTTDNNKFTSEFEKKVKDGNIQESDIWAANCYVLGAHQLGWINCDRFVNFPGPKTNFSILLDDPRNTFVNVIFQRFKSIMPGAPETDRIRFKDVPAGEKITIVAVKIQGNKILLSVKKAEIAENAEIQLDFQAITFDILKTEMEKLNQ